MLSLDAPHILQLIRDFPGGLRVIDVGGQPCLAIKAHKEPLLAARINKGFKIYVAPVPFENRLTIGLISAFFDDLDEPLTITTPLFDGDAALLDCLLQDRLDIRFFDEHAREWMGYRCTLTDGGSLLEGEEKIFLLPQYPDLSIATQCVVAIQQAVEAWFSCRTPKDDERAIVVSFCEELFPSDIAIIDMHNDANNCLGGGGFSISMLTREKRIGDFQERDIVYCFRRALASEQITLNPKRRVAHGNEFADVVVETDNALVIVQAKDCENTEKSLGRAIKRKLDTSKVKLKKGVKQAANSLRFIRMGEPVSLSIDGHDVDLYVRSRTIVNLVIIQETFPQQGAEILDLMREWWAHGNLLLIMDYPGFDAFTYQFATEDELVSAFKNYAEAQLARNSWIKPQSYALDAFVKLHRVTSLLARIQ